MHILKSIWYIYEAKEWYFEWKNGCYMKLKIWNQTYILHFRLRHLCSLSWVRSCHSEESGQSTICPAGEVEGWRGVGTGGGEGWVNTWWTATVGDMHRRPSWVNSVNRLLGLLNLYHCWSPGEIGHDIMLENWSNKAPAQTSSWSLSYVQQCPWSFCDICAIVICKSVSP